jgi:hypothetical protein
MITSRLRIRFSRLVAIGLFLSLWGPRLESQGKSGKARVQGVQITISRHGFSSQRLAPISGRFLLSVENRSGFSPVVLRLNKMDGANVLEISVAREQPDWSQYLDLAPGSYVLKEANHDDWTCSFEVK